MIVTKINYQLTEIDDTTDGLYLLYIIYHCGWIMFRALPHRKVESAYILYIS